MLPPLHFGWTVAQMLEKQAGGFGAGGKALGGMLGSVAKATGSLAQTPAAAGRKAMLQARGTLSAGAPQGMLKNPSQKFVNVPAWATGGTSSGKSIGGPTSFLAGPDFLPRREALQSVGTAAARSQLQNQAMAGAGGALAYGAMQPKK
jgi:hypothetical protein